jgi:P pilus assembly chaperone PapD
MQIPKRLLVLTNNHNKRRVVALTVLSGCLFFAPAARTQTNTTNVTQPARTFLTELKARMHGGSNLFEQTHDAAIFDLTVQSAAPAPSSVLPQFAFGGGWYSALYFTNLTGAAVSFPVSFVGDAGTPLTVPSLGGSTTQVKLAAYGTAIIEAPNVGSLVQGYAAFTLPSGVFGYGVFRGQGDQEAVVPLSDAGASSNTLTWDETNLITAVAIVNPSSTAATVGVTLWDENGNTIGTSSVALPPNGKMAAALRSLPGLGGMVGKRGSARFSVSAGSVAVLGLRFDGLAFTSIPTTNSTSASSSRSSILPQFAFGGGWYTALYFTNLTGAAVSFPVSFVGDAGTPLTVPSLGGSTTQVKLAAYGTAVVEAPNVGSLIQGYAAFTLPGGVFGYGVFRDSVAGQSDQEAVVPLSDAGASSNTLTWDETNLTTAVAIVNPSPTAANVGVTLWDENGNTIGTSSVALPPNGKTAAALRNLPGLSGMLGKRGSAQFKVSTGSVDVLGLRFGPSAFTSIPTTGTSGNVVAERALAQTGLGIGLASTVLQSQFAMVLQVLGESEACKALTGGGSVRWSGSGLGTTYYGFCTQPYVVTSPSTTVTTGNNQLAVSETASYYGLNGTMIGTLTLNETVLVGETTNLYGLGIFTPAAGARTPVQLGLSCSLSGTTNTCSGGVAQDFPALGIAIGAVSPLTLTVSTTTGPVGFTGSGSVVTGPIGSLTLTTPSPTSLVVQGGTPFASTTCSGSAGAFELFPPTPTSWTLADSTHDQQLQISVVDNTSRNLTITIKEVSTGITLATGALDQSGSGTITYSDGSIAAITNWTLAD